MNLSRRTSFVAIAIVMVAGCLAPPAATAITHRWEGIDYGKQNNALNPGFHTGAHCAHLGSSWLGSGCYYGDDDDFRVFDSASDGRRVGLEWKTDYGCWGMCVSARGNGRAGERKCYHDFREGRTVLVRVMVCDRDAYSCGRPVKGSGWFGEDGGEPPTAWRRSPI